MGIDFILKKSSIISNFENSKEIYENIREDDKFFGQFNLGFIDFYSGEIRGSNPLRTGQINRLLKDSELRIAVPEDNSKGKIYNLLGNKYTTDFNALVVQGNPPSYLRNHNLWVKMVELAEEENGHANFPFIIQGFYTFSDKSEPEYGVKITPGSNFKIIEDDRLSIKYDGKKFKTFDERGLPLLEELKRDEGPLKFRTREDGLSRIMLREGGLFCHFSNLADFVCEDPDIYSRMIFLSK
ncbi:MAG: hypothetical protein Q8Q04_01175 [archaeon]|nr:hypothetical protein [archaeon]